MISTVGRLRADSSSFSSRAGATTRTRPVRLERAEDADEVLRPDRVEPERVDDLDRLVAELRGERAAEREALHLARQALLVRARVRPEDDAAAAVVRRVRRALPGAAGALLAVRLRAAAADLAAGLGVVRAGPPAGELGGHDLVEDGGVDRGREQLVAELDAADGRLPVRS